MAQPRSPGYRIPADWETEQPTMTVRQIKDSFWQNVICPIPHVRRLVAKAEMFGESRGDREPAELLNVFRPESVDDDFNLVLSLCTDGRHRLTVDWDNGTFNNFQEKEFGELIGTIHPLERPHMVCVTPSTENSHLWGFGGMSWENMRKILEHPAINNPGYAMMNTANGFCSLRPPWITKYGVGRDDDVRPGDYFHYFGISEPAPPPPVPGVGWEELGWDDE